jgi:hypothetical protein
LRTGRLAGFGVCRAYKLKGAQAVGATHVGIAAAKLEEAGKAGDSAERASSCLVLWRRIRSVISEIEFNSQHAAEWVKSSISIPKQNSGGHLFFRFSIVTLCIKDLKFTLRRT